MKSKKWYLVHRTSTYREKMREISKKNGSKPPIQFGNKHALGMKHTNEWKKERSEWNKKHNIKPPKAFGNKWNIGRKQKKETIEKRARALSIARKGKPFPQVAGEKNNFWKGGITPINKKIRNSLEYKLWREAIFVRDDWTCQNCLKKGGKLHAHHILSFSKFPELRFAINNGITLCKECHKKTDSYLKG